MDGALPLEQPWLLVRQPPGGESRLEPPGGGSISGHLGSLHQFSHVLPLSHSPPSTLEPLILILRIMHLHSSVEQPFELQPGIDFNFTFQFVLFESLDFVGKVILWSSNSINSPSRS